MSGAPTPQLLLEAIATDAGSPYITNPMPDAPTGTNAGSIQQGFPPVTMQDENAGGEPPLGQDMNGYLFLISSHTLYVQCGQPYFFNSTLATKIGGYLLGTILGMTDGTGLWLCTSNGNTTNPDTGGAGWVPIAAYGFTNITGLIGGTVTLTPAQTKYGVIVLNGILISNLKVLLPPNIQQWLIVNATTGAFTTTVATTQVGSVGISVAQGGLTAPLGIYSIGDGQLYPTVAPLGAAIDQNPTPSTIVERTNTGMVLATYFNGNTALETPTVGAVIVQNTAADGNFRKISLTNFEAQEMLQGLSGQVTNGQVPYSVVQQWVATFLANAALTGVPTTPTAATGNSSSQVASTAFANPGVVINGNGVCLKLPNGFYVQFGTFTRGSGAGTVTVTFPVNFPTGAQFAPSITPNSFPVSVTVDSYNQAQMVVGTSGGGGWFIVVGN
jgi:hypothetical protein